MRQTHAMLAATLLAVTALQAQQARPTFRSGTATVSIYATVRASDGSLVPDLTADDFEIRDNGTARDVTVFSREIVPITVVMMLDMSGSQEMGVEWMRDAGNAFVDQLLPADRARIGTFGVEIAISPRLTSDRTYLHRVLAEEVWPGGSTPLWDAIDRAMTSLAGESGRRVILVLTDGVDTTSGGSISFPSGLTSASGKAWTNDVILGRYASVVTRTLREEFMVYAVGHAVRPSAAPRADALSGPMRALAADSGGGYRVFTDREDALSAMAQVADELHHQYLIGFTPAVIDGKVHKLEVKVRRGGMSVQARKNYVAEK